MRSVENAECGKCGVWKMRSVENAECGKNALFSIFHVNFPFPILILVMSMLDVEDEACVIWKLTNHL